MSGIAPRPLSAPFRRSSAVARFGHPGENWAKRTARSDLAPYRSAPCGGVQGASGLPSRGSCSACRGLAGCGVVDRVMATPTITELPSQPGEIAPTVPVAGASGSTDGRETTGAPVVAVPSTPSSSAPAGPKLPQPGGLQPTERLVVVDQLGLGFAAPTLFMEIDPEKYLEGTAALDELAGQMGLSPDQLRNGLLNQLDRMVVGRADDGRTASIVVARTPLDGLPSAALIRKDIGGLLGGTVSSVTRVATPAGPAVRAVYRIGPQKFLQHGEAFYLATTDGAVASVTVTSFSAAESKRMGARVVKTLRLLE